MSPIHGTFIFCGRRRKGELQSPAELEEVSEFSQSLTSDAVSAHVSAVASAVAYGLVSSDLRFSLGDRHSCAIIARRDGFFDDTDMDSENVIGRPFAKTVSMPPLDVVGVGVPHVVTGELVVTKSQNEAQFDPALPLRGLRRIHMYVL